MIWPLPPGAPPPPERLPSPFAPCDATTPPPLARVAAAALMARLEAGVPGVDLAELDVAGRGKMFGVLVVATADGTIGALQAFSGMLGGRWLVDGFAPPLFSIPARDAFWPIGEAELRALDAALAAHDASPTSRALALQASALAARLEGEDAALTAVHAARKQARHAARAAGGAALGSLAEESRADTRERRALDAAHATQRADLAAHAAAHAAARTALEAARTTRSRELLAQIYDTYTIPSATGETRTLWQLFAPDVPPGGAGDCAAPKLLAEAYRLGARPLALAEFWWGAPPLTGGRSARAFYPACRRKCGGVLPFMLEGSGAQGPPLPGETPAVGDDEPRTVFEDAWLVVVDKPVGLLSVPGRHARLTDSAQTRLRARYPAATGPLVVHRLDLDTSGLLLAAKDSATHAALARQFARREIDKRYLAWVAGDVAGDTGVIELALRVDVDDRPRQIVDPVHGKPARTEWRVCAREPGRTLVELVPRTGRTHQLRVHCAHPQGLAAAILGDRIYGRGDDATRLMLHAQALTFVHPHTGAQVTVTRPAPFHTCGVG